MKKIVALGAFLMLGQFLFSQDPNTDPVNYYYSLESELSGVYQIQMVNSRMKPMIDTPLLELIKSTQSETEEVSFLYKENIRIIIKSKQAVQAGDKFSEEEHIIYINE